MAEQHEAAAAAAEAERQELIGELAAARGTTVALEEERQQAIADEEAAEREREAREDRQDREDREEVEDPQPTTEPTREPTSDPDEDSDEDRNEPTPTQTPSSSPTPTSTPTPTPTQSPTPTQTPTRTPTPTPTPTPTQPPQQPDGAEAAIEYARQQIGKPYEWGGSGPHGFDCSGLTMRAWQAGGKSLPHWSVAQAQQVTRIPYSQIERGDLIFWSDNGQASGVYHVGLYIGGGQMIHAPRPGKNVEVQSVFYWRDPAFYGRV
nr:C40 family peptidase [Phytoactinopolyspora mesophila]